MKVVQVVPSLSQSTGGLFVSISHLARYSIRYGADVVICSPRDHATPDELAAWAPAEICTYPRFGPAKFGFAPGLVRGLERIAPDIVHSHGVWSFTSIAAARWSRRTSKPYVVSIHGMLEPWALQQSSFKKRLARWLYQDALLQNAGALRATSDMEAQNVRAAGFRTPIAIVPNGVELPERPAEDFRSQSRPKRKALFVSRIHPKKGLLNLVAAWDKIRPSDWELTILGPSDRGHAEEVQAAIVAAGLERSIHMPGPVWGAARFRYFWESDLFVLPSFSENFAMVVAEALACEVPVITTKGLPWQELEEHRCGWWIDIGTEPLTNALRAAMQLSDSERAEMGRRGRDLIAGRYNWERSAKRMTDVYRWLAAGTARPDWVWPAGEQN